MNCQNPITSILSQKERWKLKQKSNVTSWYNTNEFNHVGQSFSLATQLFPSSSTASTIPYYHDISNAIKRVTIWRKRSNHNNNGRLPNSIDITASLAESLLQDAIQQQQQQESRSFTELTNHSSMSLRLTYASTIIRGVNGIADTMSRNRSIHIATAAATTNDSGNNNNASLSVAKLCSRVGLPSWIVDLRHDASHQELPSLITLRLGATLLLECYMNLYWNVIMNNKLELKMKGLDYLIELESCNKNEVDRNNNKDGDNGNDDNREDEIEKKNENSSKCTSNDDNNNENTLKKGDSNTKNNKKQKEGNNVASFGLFNAFLEMEEEQKQKRRAERKAERLKNEMKKKQKKKLKTTKKIQTQQRQSILRKQEQCMKGFLKSVPIDIAYDLLSSYFVWGGIDIGGDGGGISGKTFHKNNCGVLIPHSKSSSFPQNQTGIRSIREQYGHTLLVQICKVWPGFIVCLFVNLVDFILVLEGELDEINAQGKVSTSVEPINTSSDGDKDISSNDYCIPSLEATKMEIVRKLYFLFSWIQYLLSNEFYYHLDWIQDIDKLLSAPVENQRRLQPQPQTQQLKSKKKNIEWSMSQRQMLESSASLDILKIAQLPLNSLCDRCITHVTTTNKNNNDTNDDASACSSKNKTTCMEIISLFNDILKDERVKNYGIAHIIQSNDYRQNHDDDQKKKRKILEVDSHGGTLLSDQVKKRKGITTVVETKLSEIKNKDNKQEENEVGDNGNGNGIDEDDNTAKKSISIIKDDDTNSISLEDMEKMLSDDRDDVGDDDDNCHKEKNNSNEENDGHPDKNSNECPQIHADTTSTSTGVRTDSRTRTIKPWTLCTSWDACAIGTLPGYVS